MRLAAALGMLAAAAGCSSGGGGDSTGTLTLGLTDGPVEGANEVVIAFEGIVLKPSGGPPMDPIEMDADSCDEFDATTGTCSIDLLELVGTDRRVVFSSSLPAGTYEWVRLLVAAEQNVMDSYIHTLTGMQCSLWIPRGSETGLQVVRGITVTANGVSDYTLDFDVRKSITNPPGIDGSDPALQCAENYILAPALRIVDSTEVGAVAGTVSEATLGSDASCEMDEQGRYENVAVYVFEDAADFVADDLDGDEGDAVTSASVAWDDVEQAYTYEAGFLLAPATYRLGLTCTADVDEADTDEFDPSLEEAQDFGFVAERSVDVDIDATADGAL